MNKKDLLETAAVIARLLLGFILISAALAVHPVWLQIALGAAGLWKLWRGMVMMDDQTKKPRRKKDDN